MPSPERNILSSPRAERGSSSRDLGPGSSPGRQLIVLHLKRADLPPSVRSYVDNLNVQVRELLKAHGAKNLHDFKRLIKERKVRVEAVENLQKLLNAYANAVRTGERPPEDLEFTEDYEDPETGETREIRLDLNEALKTTSEFFHTFGLDELREALPKSIHLTDEQKELVRKKMQEGFNFALVMPPTGVLNHNTEQILEATSMVVTKRSKGFSVRVTNTDYEGGDDNTGVFKIAQNQSTSWLARELRRGYKSSNATPYLVLMKVKKAGDLVFLHRNREDHEIMLKQGNQPLDFKELLLAMRYLTDRNGFPLGSVRGVVAPVSVPDVYVELGYYFYEKKQNELYINLRRGTWHGVGFPVSSVNIPLEA